MAEAVRIVLSGVARTEARFPCGKNLIAQMLCGSASAKVAKLRLNQLSTFGLLSHLTQPEVVTLVEALVAAGYLEQVDLDRFRPVVRLTELGTEVMAGRQAVDARLSLPAYLLLKLRAPRPGSAKGATAGLSSSAENTVGQANRGTRRSSPPGATAGSSSSAPPAAASRPPHYWTWRLLSTGFTVEECAAARGLSPQAVLDHALRAVEEGWRVEARWCLPPELLAAVSAVVGEERPRQIRPLLAQLPPGTSYQQVEIFLKCRGPHLRGGRYRVE